MEKMEITIVGEQVEVIHLPAENVELMPSDEYVARRKAAGKGLPIIDFYPPEGEEE